MSTATPAKAVHQMTPYERERDIEPIIEDILRAFRLSNYSLLWRYLSHEFAQTFDAQAFKQFLADLNCPTEPPMVFKNLGAQTWEIMQNSGQSIEKPEVLASWSIAITESESESESESETLTQTLNIRLANRKEFIEVTSLHWAP